MNSAEKRIFSIALSLFIIGFFVRVVPWGLPSIEQINTPMPSVFAFEYTENKPKVKKKKETPEEGTLKKTKSKKPKKKKKSKKIIRLPIRINEAGVDELCALKGVGPKLAEKILEYKEVHGPFKTPEDLKKVPGIGKKKAEGILLGVIFD